MPGDVLHGFMIAFWFILFFSGIIFLPTSELKCHAVMPLDTQNKYKRTQTIHIIHNLTHPSPQCLVLQRREENHNVGEWFSAGRDLHGNLGADTWKYKHVGNDCAFTELSGQ